MLANANANASANAAAPLQLRTQLAEADEAGLFNTPAAQTGRRHAALKPTEILLASGRAEALPCLLAADALIWELPWQWPGLPGLLRHLERLVTLVRTLKGGLILVLSVLHRTESARCKA